MQQMVGITDAEMATVLNPNFALLFPDGTSNSICFASLRDAREALTTIVVEYFRQQSEEGAKNCLKRLENWSDAMVSFSSFSSYHDSTLNQADRRAIVLLQIQHRYFKLSLLPTLIPSWTGSMWDEHVDEFGEIAELAALALGFEGLDGAITEIQPQFHLEVGTTAILYDVVTQCRDPWIRRKALNLLCSTTLQEGIWNSRLTARVASRIVDLEESGLDEVRTCSDVPEHTRVQYIELKLHLVEKRGSVQYFPIGWREVITW